MSKEDKDILKTSKDLLKTKLGNGPSLYRYYPNGSYFCLCEEIRKSVDIALQLAIRDRHNFRNNA